jgi:glycosyltransferase involved in cell wall biosynthesis
MNSRPSITVITPVFNGAQFLDAALETVAAQQYPNLEHVIVDDGSTDGFNGKGPFRYLRQENRGPSAARNLALAESKSDLVAFLDIDDLWTPGHLSRMADALEADSGAGIAQGLIRCFLTTEDGQNYLMSKAFRFYLLGSALYRREVFQECGNFEESLLMSEDYDFALRCWERDIAMAKVEQVSLHYRRHGDAFTAKKVKAVDTGLVKVYKRRADRIRQGLVDPKRPTRVTAAEFLGTAPAEWDEGLRDPIHA